MPVAEKAGKRAENNAFRHWIHLTQLNKLEKNKKQNKIKTWPFGNDQICWSISTGPNGLSAKLDGRRQCRWKHQDNENSFSSNGGHWSVTFRFNRRHILSSNNISCVTTPRTKKKKKEIKSNKTNIERTLSIKWRQPGKIVQAAPPCGRFN